MRTTRRDHSGGRSKSLRTLATTTALAAAALLSMPARAIDVDPGDYTALPGGTNAMLLYYQHATRDSLYSQGNKVPINPGLDSDVGILRGVHFMDLGGYTTDVQFLLPFGSLKAKDDLAPLGSASGAGDLLVAATVWLTKPGAKTHFGITPFLVLPTGSYDRNKALNLGENRMKFILNAGYITELAPGLNMDLLGDVTLFGKNTDANDGAGGKTTLEQKAQYEFQASLRYNISPAVDIRGQVSYVTGGETKLGGVNQNDKTTTTKFNIGSGWFFRPTTQLLATYGRDLSVENGFKINNELHLRLLQLF